nr:uncharacterized protein LOC104117382 [Nicotiana tomentosiformis]
MAKSIEREPIKYFRFLDFWTKQEDFKAVVELAWGIDVHGSPMWRFHLKQNNTCKKLSEWSETTIGNTFDKVKDLEGRVADLEANLITDNNELTRTSLNEVNALLIRAYKKEESFWKQKYGVKWFVEGEVNSKFFHSVVKGTDIPKALTHTFLVLLPKMDSPQSFTELRPISLSNFSCKIISKLMNQRLSPLMQKLVSPNQTGFIKGRSITENIMLTQDMIHNINESSLAGNVVLKLYGQSI